MKLEYLVVFGTFASDAAAPAKLMF